MSVNLSELGDFSTLSALVADVEAQSAFMSASPQQVIRIGIENALITSAAVSLGLVAEGGTKPAGGSLDSVILTPQKVAGILVNTTEVLANIDVGEVLGKTAPAQIAEYFDLSVAAGTIGNLSTSTEVAVDTWTDLHTAFGAVKANGIVASSGFVSRLLGFRNAAGVEYLPQSGKVEQILGVPVYTFQSAESVAYVGDFKNQARWGAAAPEGGIVKRFDQGIVVEGEVEHNLLQENKVAYRVESYLAHGANASKFRKLTIADADTDTED